MSHPPVICTTDTMLPDGQIIQWGVFMLDFDVECCHRSSCSEISDHMLLAFVVSMNESYTGTNQTSVLCYEQAKFAFLTCCLSRILFCWRGLNNVYAYPKICVYVSYLCSTVRFVSLGKLESGTRIVIYWKEMYMTRGTEYIYHSLWLVGQIF